MVSVFIDLFFFHIRDNHTWLSFYARMSEKDDYLFYNLTDSENQNEYLDKIQNKLIVAKEGN